MKLTLSNGKIYHEVINTRNIKNRQIVIDNSTEREEHNQYICELMDNKEEYSNYINSLILREKVLLNNLFPSFGSLSDIIKFVMRWLIRKDSLRISLYDKIKDGDERPLYLNLMNKNIKHE